MSMVSELQIDVSTEPDIARAEAFLEKVFTDLSTAMITSMSALGDRLGLFKDLATYGPGPSEEIAGRTGLNERYVREWLSAMVSAGYLTYNPARSHFELPQEHALVLANEEGPMFMGGLLQEIPHVLGVLDLVAEAFRLGGGVRMSDYDPRLWEGMERETTPAFNHALIQEWIPALPGVAKQLQKGASVADIGCGSGRALINLAQAFPKSRFVGYDNFQAQLDRASANAQAAGVSGRVQFVLKDAAQGLPEQYDLITTFDVVHDAVDPRGLLRAIRQGLQPGGVYLCKEYNYSENLEENIGPLGAFLYSASVFYCMTTSLARGGEGLGTAGLPESKLRQMAREAGFQSVERLKIEDPFSAFYFLKA